MPRPDKERDAPEFRDLAPVYETFPGFKPGDFAAFTKPKQRDEAFNGERLVVKRKLAALGKAISAALAAAGLPVEAKTSLSHPYTYNGYRVDSMWVYFGRDEKAKKAIKSKLGGELGKDVDPTYQGVILLVEIDEKRIACGMKIHPAAWWDGQNIKWKIQRAEGAAKELTSLLNALPRGYVMTLGDWKRRYEAGKLYEADIRNYFQYFSPGEQWLHLLAEVPTGEAIEAGPAFAERAAALVTAAVPVWRFAAWAPTNDVVLAGRGGES
jgi:hypothetical protein